MWIIFGLIFLGLFAFGVLVVLLFSKVFNYMKIEDIKTKNKIKKLEEEEREEKN